MAQIITTNVALLFMSDTLMYCLSSPEITFSSYMMNKHKWTEDEYNEYLNVYMRWIEEQQHYQHKQAYL